MSKITTKLRESCIWRTRAPPSVRDVTSVLRAELSRRTSILKGKRSLLCGVLIRRLLCICLSVTDLSYNTCAFQSLELLQRMAKNGMRTLFRLSSLVCYVRSEVCVGS
jgi:hypothetical protein